MANTEDSLISDELKPEDENIDEKTLREWTIEAEKGSSAHQVKLGTHYLKLAELDIDREENGGKAVTWLVKASQAGDEMATEKLRHCVKTDLGVTKSNKADVVWCLNTSTSEKRIRNAARSLFTSLGPGQNGVMSKDEYMKAIDSLTAGHEKEKKILLAAGKKIGDTITENDFVKTISKKIQGTLTLTADETDETTAAYNAASAAQKVFLYPKQTATVLFDHTLEFASKEGFGIVTSLIPTNQIYLFAMVFAYSYLRAELFLLVVPLLSFFISFAVLVIATLQMFYKRRKQKDASSLVSLLKNQFDSNIDVQSTESQYSWNSLTPYYVFFSSLPIMVLSFSICNKGYVPCAEMMVVGIAMTITCFIGLSDTHDILTFAALASHAFASLPTLLAGCEDIPVVSVVVAILTRPLFSVYLGVGVSFNFSLPAIVHMLIPFLFLRMALRGGWTGVLKTLVPHVVCYCWFSFAISAFPFTTWWSLARANVGYLFLPVFAPVSLIALVFGFFFFLYKLLQTQMVGKLIVTGLLIAVPILMSQTKSLFGKKSKKPESEKVKKIKKAVMIGFSIVAVLPLLFIQMPTISKTKSLELSMQDYQALCTPGEGETNAPYQLRCRDFLGTRVNWTGKVTQVQITNVENSAQSVIKSLPSILAEPFLCTYGDPLPDCDPESMSEKTLRHCELIASTGKKCHLRGHDILTFSITLSVADGALTVTAEAGDNFKSRMMALEQGDEVEFSGTLVDAGTTLPKLKLRSIACTSRVLPVMEEVQEDEVLDDDALIKMAGEAVQMIFNFGLFPVLSFSPDF